MNDVQHSWLLWLLLGLGAVFVVMVVVAWTFYTLGI